MNNPLVQLDPGLAIWTILVFLGLLFALKALAWNPLLTALKGRQDAITKSLDDARQARQELARLHTESARLLAAARQDAEWLISRTREDAKQCRVEM